MRFGQLEVKTIAAAILSHFASSSQSRPADLHPSDAHALAARRAADDRG
jgi:hypothetical protein